MTLPLSRNTTYAPGMPVKSLDLNDVQDMIIGGYHGEKPLIVPPEFFGFAGSPWTFNTFNASLAYEPRIVHAVGSAEEAIIPMPLHVGDRIKAVEIYTRQDTATLNALQFRLYQVHRSTASPANAKSALVGTAAAATRQVVTLTGITPEVILTGQRWFVVVGANANILKEVSGCQVIYDRPRP